jgi:hypothetical protein
VTRALPRDCPPSPAATRTAPALSSRCPALNPRGVRPVPGKVVSPRDLCPDTGLARLSYGQARALFDAGAEEQPCRIVRNGRSARCRR